MNQAKRMAVKWLSKMGLYPHIYFSYSPFKVLEYEAVMEAARPSYSDEVLDVGCGGGLQSLLTSSKAGRVVGVDPNSQYIKQARDTAWLLNEYPRAEFYTGTVFSGRRPSDSFDLVLFICVLEHIKDYRAALDEAYRVLRPGGRIVLTVDSLAIAAQALIGRFRGAGDMEQARRVADRLVVVGFAVGLVLAGVLLLVSPWLPGWFTPDPAVAAAIDGIYWFLLAGIPLSAVVFVWDGVFLGAGDFAYLAVAMVGAGVIGVAMLALASSGGPGSVRVGGQGTPAGRHSGRQGLWR